MDTINIQQLQERIENDSFSTEDILTAISLIDRGTIRVAEKINNTWEIHAWVKKSIIKYFGITTNHEFNIGELYFRDKLALKKEFENVRIVPGGNAVRYGSYLADHVIMMPPSYVNIGAYVGTGTMIDSNALVGSCAQIGAHVHLSAGVQIGGVLEPVNAQPVIVEDHAFIGAGAIVVEGMLIEEHAVIAPGVVLSGSTKIIETDSDGQIINEFYNVIPANAIVVPGARMRGQVMIQSPIVIGYKNEKTGAKLELSQFLRDF